MAMDAGVHHLVITVDAPTAQASQGTADARVATQFPGSPRDTVTSSGMALRVVDTPPKMRVLVSMDTAQGDGADYELLESLGQGGMGEVMAARQMALDRIIAIKRLPEFGISARDQAHLRSEALITGGLDHPNIIPIYDFGIDQHGRTFFAMKKVQGKLWSERFKQLALHENLEILIRVCDAIAFAHSRGVIHRDLKPENVMIGEFGEVLVMDWGLAVHTEDLQRASEHERFASGSPAYMAPEMAYADYQRIGPRSDIYLLGAILFELLTGVPPHPGEQAMECMLNAMKNLIRPEIPPGELADIARKALASNQDKRFQHVGELQEALRAAHQHADSTRLGDKAGEAFDEASGQGRHDLYARAIAGYEQALVLWADNGQAQTGLLETKRAFARHALSTGDLDLAASLVETPSQIRPVEMDDLQRKVSAAFRARGTLRRRMRWLTGAVVAAVILIVVVSLTAALLTRAEQTRMIAAIRERDTAELHLAAMEQRAWKSVIAEDFSGDQMPAAVHSLKGIWSLNKDRLVAVGPDIALAELAALGSGSLRLSFDLVNDQGVAVYLGVDRSDLPDHPERSRISAMFIETTCEVRSGSKVKKKAAIPPFHGNIPRHIILELDAGSLRILVDGHPIVEKVDGIQANDAGGSRLAISAQAGASIDNLRVDRLDLAEAPHRPL